MSEKRFKLMPNSKANTLIISCMILSYSIVFQFDTTLCRDIFLQKVLFLFRFWINYQINRVVPIVHAKFIACEFKMAGYANDEIGMLIISFDDGVGGAFLRKIWYIQIK